MENMEENSEDNRKQFQHIRIQNKKKHNNSTDTKQIGIPILEIILINQVLLLKTIPLKNDTNNKGDLPTYEEYNEIIKKLKSNKAAGEDTIGNKQAKHLLDFDL